MIRKALRFALLALCAGTALGLTSAAQALPDTAACKAWSQSAINPDANTDQILVMRGDGTILFQWTDGVYKINTPHALWSVSKSVTATIVAIAIQQGRLKITDHVAKYIPNSERPNTTGSAEYAQLTIDDLFSMTSGFKWNEHGDAGAQEQSDLPMLYYSGYHNVVTYALAQSFEATPGKVWNYSSLNADLLMGVLRKIYGKSYDKMPWNNLFDPLGMTSAHFEQDKAGNFVGAAYAHLSPPDLAKLGLLYLHDGVTHGGKRLLPVGWVTHVQTPVAASLAQVRAAGTAKNEGPYGHGSFWLNADVGSIRRPYINAPTSTFVAEGVFGQALAIYPQANLVLVRTGHDQSDDNGADNIVSGALACFGAK